VAFGSRHPNQCWPRIGDWTRSIRPFVLGTAVPLGWLQLGGGAILLGLGGWRLWRTRHPILVGMRVGFSDLTSWSWIMASAHGAGVMLIPLLLGATCGETLSGKVDYCFPARRSPLALCSFIQSRISSWPELSVGWFMTASDWPCCADRGSMSISSGRLACSPVGHCFAYNVGAGWGIDELVPSKRSI